MNIQNDGDLAGNGTDTIPIKIGGLEQKSRNSNQFIVVAAYFVALNQPFCFVDLSLLLLLLIINENALHKIRA